MTIQPLGDSPETYPVPPAPPTSPVYSTSIAQPPPSPPLTYQQPPVAYAPAPSAVHFGFDGGAGTWLGVQIGGALITILTLGICYPWAVVMTYRWKAKHTYLNGHRLRFTGSAPALFGSWVKWLLLTLVTLGIYSFWLYPALTRWIVEHQELDPVR